MADLRICRICLRTDARMYKFDQLQLKSCYESVMALKISNDDPLPHSFCYECAALLQKFHKFKDKCFRGQKILQELHWRGLITYELVHKIDRIHFNLKSSIDNMALSSKIKSFSLKDPEITDVRTNTKESQTFQVETVDLKVDVKVDPEENTFVDIDDDGFLDNKEDLIDFDAEQKTLEKTVVIELEPKMKPPLATMDAKKTLVKPRHYRLKRRNKMKKDVKKNPPIVKRKKIWRLDSNFWKTLTLVEEDAMKEFRARAEDSKYEKAAYKCHNCLKGFSKEDMLKRHTILRHKDDIGQYDCKFCHFRFKWPSKMRIHMREHFIRYQCLRCPYVCSLESSAVVHEEFHSGVKKKCLHCGQEFRHSSTYYSHLRTYHRSEYICTLCGVSFVSDLGLQQHKKLKHIAEDIENPESPGDFEDVNTFCERCDIRFETRTAYEEHVFHSIMHADGYDALKADDVSLPPKALGRKIKEQIKEKLQKRKLGDDIPEFGVSDRKESKKTGYWKRLQRKPTTCHQCGKQFDTQAACMKHHLSEHPRTSFYPASERHICEVCGVSLAPGSIQNHQNTHTREKIYRCDICGREFNSSVSMKRHHLTHTGEKPFGCPLCEKRFTQSNSMKLHYRTFHLKQPYPKRNRNKKALKGKSEEESYGSQSEAEMDTVQPSGQKPRSLQNAAPEVTEQHNSSYFNLN